MRLWELISDWMDWVALQEEDDDDDHEEDPAPTRG